MSDPFHDGERAILEITGERAVAATNGRIIGDAVPPPAVPFVASQELAVLSREDADGRLWAGIVFGPKTFASVSEDRRTLTMTPSGGASMRGAPLDGLTRGDRLGALFIELTTRRRLRVNGTVDSTEAGQLEVKIEEAYPACPKYIQRRVLEPASNASNTTAAVNSGTKLTEALQTWITKADTIFVASGPRGQRLDVSHRGGEPGFLRIMDGRLRVPDYPGNSMFNTSGNFRSDPRAGLVVPDFATGQQLSLTGTATLHVDGPAIGDPSGPTGGTDRWWDFAPEVWVITTLATPRGWSLPEPSPFNPTSGEIR